jgi:hypothetical protein
MADTVHIGYYKTGTTALQTYFFPSLPDCSFVTHWGSDGSIFRPLIKHLYHAEDGEYPEETLRTFLEHKRQKASHLFVSDENLCGCALLGHYNWERNATRLHRLLPEAKIIITIRAQDSMLRALYSLYTQRGGYGSFNDFVLNRAPVCSFSQDQLAYDLLVSRYQELFGVDRVRVIPFELFLQDRASFLREFSSFIVPEAPDVGEVKIGNPNRSLSRPSRWFIRHVNRSFRASVYNPRPSVVAVPGAQRVLDVLRNRVDPLLFNKASRGFGAKETALLEETTSRYRESNRRLEQLTGLSLSAFGYPLPGAGARGAQQGGADAARMASR